MNLVPVHAASLALAEPLFSDPQDHGALGVELSLWSLLPFAGLLLAIALLPLFAGKWWEHNRNKAVISLLFSAPIVVYLLVAFGGAGAHALTEKAQEYASFLVLLGALFVITGGIYVEGSLSGTPVLNTAILGIGAVIANAIGTTGASVLLIRPLLRANEARQRKTHIVVFFIFVVSNCGGLLTPLGDPPLFLGYLRGVPFEWTLGLLPQWALVNASLLLVFNVWDQIVFNVEERELPGSQLEEVQAHARLRLDGASNLLLLFGVVTTIYASGAGVLHGGEPWTFGIQEGLIIGLTLLAFFSTSERIHRANRFRFAPIIEVAVLFAGIFVTMAPALLVLNAWSLGQRDVAGISFGMHEPWHFFWASGGLSSFLDNAPTYLTFAATAAGLEGVPVEGRYLAALLERGPAAARILAAVSCGSVLMGAMTYIGNGPNFMIRAIAEENGIRMPGFFRYMLYSTAILLPLFVVVTFVFFR
jgi:Na+/H+ antiporter NhaD/arsenite permease-like protein